MSCMLASYVEIHSTRPAGPTACIHHCANHMYRYFKVSERGSSIGTEIKAGVITFLTMSYILLVNPQILGAAGTMGCQRRVVPTPMDTCTPQPTTPPPTGLQVEHVVASTALSSALASIFCGVLANFPLGMAPGMGVNAFLVYSQVLGLGVSVHAALACCFTAALIVALLAVVRLLSSILAVVPNTIKMATVVGMGLLLSFIGLQTAKIVIADKETMVGLGNLGSLEPMLAVWWCVWLGQILIHLFVYTTTTAPLCTQHHFPHPPHTNNPISTTPQPHTNIPPHTHTNSSVAWQSSPPSTSSMSQVPSSLALL